MMASEDLRASLQSACVLPLELVREVINLRNGEQSRRSGQPRRCLAAGAR